MRIVVLGNPRDVLGFALAGVEGRVCETPEEARDRLRDVLAGGAGADVGLLVLSGPAAWEAARDLRERAQRAGPPIVVRLPEGGRPA